MRWQLTGILLFTLLHQAALSQEASRPNEYGGAAYDGGQSPQMDSNRIRDLIKQLKSEDAVRCKAILELGELRRQAAARMDRETQAQLEEVLLREIKDGSEEASVRAISALTFKEPRAKSAVPILVDLLNTKVLSERRRVNILSALRRLGTQAASAKSSLMTLVGDRTVKSSIRCTALATLAAVAPSPDLVETLRAMTIDKNEDQDLRCAAAIAMVPIDPAAARGCLRELLREPQFAPTPVKLNSHRLALIAAITKVEPDTWSARFLAKVSEDQAEYSYIRELAIDTLGKMKRYHNVSVPALHRILLRENPSDEVFVMAVSALGRIGPPARECQSLLEAIRKDATNQRLFVEADQAVTRISAK